MEVLQQQQQLEAIRAQLPLATAGRQAAVQQLGGRHKSCEQHNGFALLQQTLHQGAGRRQFVVRADLAQGSEHREHLSIPSHQPGVGTAAVVVHLELKAVLKASAFGLTELHRQQ